ncbi:universal stress protein [Lysobacter antibioticus]|uniref:Universal stress family protein n=1 Tax=Lysobacter antibioticus TaxID=84531 RepID=A0A0S2FBX8_LYSAN|nr:universal stress protein [Lysobacter antibioticus]ALN81038.1 universal stress family protein [Lysobacter antibioticus]
MYKDLMIPMTGSDGDADALTLAMALAKSSGARLTALEMVDLPMPMTHPWGLTPDAATADLHAALRERGQINLAKLELRLASECISAEARLVEALYSEAPRLAAKQAYDADLTIVAGAIGDTVESILPHDYFVALLLESGRPVLVVPPRCVLTVPPRRVVIAWQPTRETARAVHDALPLLTAAESVEVLTVETDDGQDIEPSARRIVEHLRRHGVEASRLVRPALGQTVATALLYYSREMRADLLVAGGYGHSRLREWALGGVTRELLIASDLPVLFGH